MTLNKLVVNGCAEVGYEGIKLARLGLGGWFRDSGISSDFFSVSMYVLAFITAYLNA